MKNKICCIFNYAPHYREAIFKKMDDELNCDFYFGDSVFMALKKMDYSVLTGYKGEFKTFKIRSFSWQLGMSKVLFKKYEPYIITGDPYCVSNWLLLIYCLVRKIKLYMWCHGLKEELHKREKLFINTFYKNASGGLLLYGHYSRNLMIKEGYDEKKLHVIYNSLDYESQVKIRHDLEESDIYEKHFQNTDPVIIFIGRLQKDKKIDLIIKAQNQLLIQAVPVNLILLGEGEMEQSLTELSGELGLSDRIWFYGSCYEERILASLVYNATLTVSPGNIGLSTMLSLVFGTPVITHGNFTNQGPEFEAITPGETGDFFAENNLNDLVVKVSLWIKKLKNNRDTFRKKCYQIIDLYYNPLYQMSILKSILK